MSLCPARMKKIQTKMKVLECSRHFSYCKSVGEFFRRSKAANSAVHGLIRLNFKLSPDFIVVLFTYKNEEHPIKNESARVVTTLYINFSDAQGQIT